MRFDLTQEGCVACKRDSPRSPADEIDALMPLIPGWHIVHTDDLPRLERIFRFGSYREALNFTASVGEIAMAEDHHPLIIIEARRVTIQWWTYAIRGLHRNDFVMAAKTDFLFNSIQP